MSEPLDLSEDNFEPLAGTPCGIAKRGSPAVRIAATFVRSADCAARLRGNDAVTAQELRDGLVGLPMGMSGVAASRGMSISATAPLIADVMSLILEEADRRDAM